MLKYFLFWPGWGEVSKIKDLNSGIFSSKILWLNISFIYGGVSDLSTPKFSHHTISYRSFKNFNEQTFKSDLQDAPWDLIKVFDDTNDVVDTWSHMFLSIVDNIYP